METSENPNGFARRHISRGRTREWRLLSLASLDDWSNLLERARDDEAFSQLAKTRSRNWLKYLRTDPKPSVPTLPVASGTGESRARGATQRSSRDSREEATASSAAEELRVVAVRVEDATSTHADSYRRSQIQEFNEIITKLMGLRFVSFRDLQPLLHGYEVRSIRKPGWYFLARVELESAPEEPALQADGPWRRTPERITSEFQVLQDLLAKKDPAIMERLESWRRSCAPEDAPEVEGLCDLVRAQMERLIDTVHATVLARRALHVFERADVRSAFGGIRALSMLLDIEGLPAHARRMLEISRAFDDPYHEALARCWIARLLVERFEYGAARDNYRISIQKAKSAGFPRVLGQSLHGLAALDIAECRHSDAERELISALESFRIAEWRIGVALCRLADLDICLRLGKLARAAQIIEQLGPDPREPDNLVVAAYVTDRLAELYLLTGRFDDAVRILHENIGVPDGDHRQAALAAKRFVRLATAEIEQNHRAIAKRHWKQARTLLDRVTTKESTVELALSLAELSLDWDDVRSAQDLFDNVMADNPGGLPGHYSCLAARVEGRILSMSGRSEEGRAKIDFSIEHAARHRELPDLARSLRSRARSFAKCDVERADDTAAAARWIQSLMSSEAGISPIDALSTMR